MLWFTYKNLRFAIMVNCMITMQICKVLSIRCKWSACWLHENESNSQKDFFFCSCKALLEDGFLDCGAEGVRAKRISSANKYCRSLENFGILDWNDHYWWLFHGFFFFAYAEVVVGAAQKCCIKRFSSSAFCLLFRNFYDLFLRTFASITGYKLILILNFQKSKFKLIYWRKKTNFSS